MATPVAILANTLSFQDVFDPKVVDEDLHTHFAKFVKDCHCEEMIQFHAAIKQFKANTATQEFDQLRDEALNIIDTYISVQAPKEINISSAQRSKIVNDSTSISPSSVKTLFDEAADAILVELNDLVMRFSRSKDMARYLEQKARQEFFQHSKLASSPSNSSLPLPSLPTINFKDESISREEVDLVLRLSQFDTFSPISSLQWKLLSSGDDFLVQSSRKRFKLNSSPSFSKGFKFIRVSGLVPIGLQQFIQQIVTVSAKQLIEHGMAQFKQVKYISRFSQVQQNGGDTSPSSPLQQQSSSASASNCSNSFAMSITHETFPVTWPLSNRDFVFANTIVTVNNNNNNISSSSLHLKELVFIQRSVETNSAPERKGVVRAKGFSGWYLKPISEGMTRYTRIMYNDMEVADSMASETIWSEILKKRAKGIHSSILKAIQVIKPVQQQVNNNSSSNNNNSSNNNSNSNNNTLGILATLQDNLLEISTPPASPRTVTPRTSPPQEAVFKQSSNSSESAVIKRLVYLSQATTNSVSNDELEHIAHTSQRNNYKLNVTGILLYCNGIFYQELEGTEENVNKVYSTVKLDSRHHSVVTLREEYGERQFNNWDMHTMNLDEIEAYYGSVLKEFIQEIKKKQAYNEQDAIEVLSKVSASKSAKEDSIVLQE